MASHGRLLGWLLRCRSAVLTKQKAIDVIVPFFFLSPLSLLCDVCKRESMEKGIRTCKVSRKTLYLSWVIVPFCRELRATCWASPTDKGEAKKHARNVATTSKIE